MGVEAQRLADADADPHAHPWRRWGPYLADRAWGTVREDYSADGDAWRSFPHDHARRRAYRWNEDGLLGLCDDSQTLCLAWALWNGADPICKERLFGLANAEGNHGEDVKEQLFHLEATPSGSWLRAHYRYPCTQYPYAELVAAAEARGRGEPEYELADTSAFAGGAFECVVSVAKAGPEDLCIELAVTNSGPVTRTLHALPTLWFRNTWSWGRDPARPVVRAEGTDLVAQHPQFGRWVLAGPEGGSAVCCDNETDTAALYGVPGPACPKDGIGRHVIDGAPTVAAQGTKGALWHQLTVPAGGTATLQVRLRRDSAGALGADLDAVLADRRADYLAWFAELAATAEVALTPEEEVVLARAGAGMVWSKCFYRYDVARWLTGDPGQPPPPPGHASVRNATWGHLDAHDVISMPDPWEYPWFAAWDLAFHCVTWAHLDPGFAQSQLLLLTQPWFAHPNGQLPAYEWDFSDVNPPVQVWAALEIFRITGGTARLFLERVFLHGLLTFTWWVNREDSEGNDLFGGGFLGLDNVGAFDRSHRPPVDGHLEQSDGTAWMALFCLDLLEAALLLAVDDPAYADLAVRFFEHFTLIASAMNSAGLWDETDGFYYDVLHLTSDDGAGRVVPLRVRSVVGLVSLAAVTVLSGATLAAIGEFDARLHWFLAHKPALGSCVIERRDADGEELHLLSVVSPERLLRILGAVCDPSEFWSPHGLRSLSKVHAAHPAVVAELGEAVPPVGYEPGESMSGLFGGNSNWRGPVWFPLNHLVLGGLRRFAAYLGPEVTVALDGRQATLAEVAEELRARLVGLFLPGPDGRRPAQGHREWPPGELLFHEYFHGDTGAGLGAEHQTGWTGLVVDLLLRRGGRVPPVA